MDKLAKTLGAAVAVAGLLLVALLWSVGATAAPAEPAEPLAPDASITLSNAPSPPTAIRPDESQAIQWQIVASTTPVSVSFRIVNLDSGALVDSQVYPGAAGMSVARGYTLPLSYTLPFGRLFERYRIQVVYYSLQSGNEASAEANFWVTQDTGNLGIVKFNDRNGNGVRDPGDEGVPGVLCARNSLTVIDGPSMSVLASVSVGRDPGMIGVNPATNKVYVANRGDDTVQVIDDTFTRRLQWQIQR